MKKKFFALSLSAVLAASLLGACGDATNNGGADSDKTSASSGETTLGSSKESNEIVVGIPQDLDDSLDPYRITAAGTREVMFNVYEGLVKLCPDGSYAPAVASGYNVTDDGLTYTFTLRDGVKFHNGAEVTTDDVLYSLEACAANTVTTSVAAALSDIKTEVDGSNIIITLPKANPDFLAYVSNAYISPKDYTDQATAPVGTGPFKFVSRSVQENVVLEKNTDYYGTPANLDRVTFRVFSDSNAEVTALESGSLDLVAHLQADQIATLTNGYNILDSTMNLAVAMYLNNAVEPFTNEKVRQALCYAVNIDEIMALATGGNGVKIGSSMFPNFTKYFDASLAENYTRDTDKAKELLKEAGYGSGFTFKLTYPSEYEHPYGDMAQAIKDELAEIGVTAELDPIPWSSWLSDVYQGRKFEATIVGFDASVLTASAMLQRWTTNDESNMINYSNEEYDQTYAAAQASTDDEEQTALYKKCLEILNQTAANVYIQDLAEYVVINPALEGYQFYPLYILDMSTVKFS